MNNSIKERTIEFVKFKGITMKSFETKCGLSSGYVTSMRKGFGSDKLNDVLTAFPELNRDWLLYGEGSMLKSGVSQTSHGDNSPNVLGNGNQVNVSSTVDKVLEEFAQQRKLIDKAQAQTDKAQAQTDKAQAQTDKAQEQVSKAQEQIDRLITLIEKMQKI